MPIVQLYHSLLAQIRQLLPAERDARLRLLAWWMSGLAQSKSVHLSSIARQLPGRSKRLSKVKRLERWLNNRFVQVRVWYRSLAEALLAQAAAHGRVRLIIDCTQVSFDHQRVMVALAFRRRALPLAWSWLCVTKGHSSGRLQCALLEYVRTLLPPEASVLRLGDREFTPLQPCLQAWGWQSALRQKGSHLVRSAPEAPWQRGARLISQPGDCAWFSHIQLTQPHQHRTHFLAWWAQGESEPWLIATTLPTAAQTRLHYSRRMWVEEMFGDFKAHGFDLEHSCLRPFQRLNRLTLIVALLYVWLIALGLKTMRAAQRHLVDRRDRRELSLFRIGLEMTSSRLLNQMALVFPSVPYFT
jgi:hypothetical protein